MPWCLHCDRYLTPPTVRTDGTCPTCGRRVDAGRAHPPGSPHGRSSTTTGQPEDTTDQAPPVPWHLKLLLVALAIYLGYRLFQGFAWVLAHI